MGDVPPVRFIQVAEESNLINTIGGWVLHEVCRQCRAWIDQSFVRGLPHNEVDAAIIRAIVGIAEGVEQPEQRGFLLLNGCRLMQGFHFGRPMAAEQLALLMGEGKVFPGA